MQSAVAGLLGTVAVAIALLTSCDSTPAEQGAPAEQRSAENGPISYSRFDIVASHIYLVAPTGGAATQLTRGPGVQAHSAWSPSGDQAVFSQVTATGSSITRINADGTGTTSINRGTPWSIVPSWSPDGSRVAFTSDSDGNFEIFAMNADGSDVRQLTFSDADTTHVGPKYSPDGKRILYAVHQREAVAGNLQDLWLMNTDGSGQTRLTTGYNNAESRTWSPDGQRIAFNSIVDGIGQIYVMNSDGTGIQQVTTNPGTTPAFLPGGIFPPLRGDITPAWSPDGGRIAFASDRDGNFEIYTMTPAGTDLVRLTETPDQEVSVGWSPKLSRN